MLVFVFILIRCRSPENVSILITKIRLKSTSTFLKILHLIVQFLQNIKDMGWKEEGRKRGARLSHHLPQVITIHPRV